MQFNRSIEPSAMRVRAVRGFTLIEVMITVAIVAILAAIALPSYRDYVLRGYLVDGTNLLSAGRADMERYFQDNRTYAAVGTTIKPPCANTNAAMRTVRNFVMTCTGSDTPTTNGYTLRATGSGPVNGFVYTIDPTGAQATPSVPTGSGWTTSTTCWLTKKGQSC